jgi:hypothetical protein
MPLMVAAHAMQESEGRISQRKTRWATSWRDTPVALRFKGLRYAVVAVMVSL